MQNKSLPTVLFGCVKGRTVGSSGLGSRGTTECPPFVIDIYSRDFESESTHGMDRTIVLETMLSMLGGYRTSLSVATLERRQTRTPRNFDA